MSENEHKERQRHAYNQIIVAERVGIAVLLQIRPDRELILRRRFALVFQVEEELLRARVEAQDVIEKAPHLGIEETRGLAEDSHEVVSGPLELAPVPRDGKCHFGWKDALREVRGELEEIDEIGVGAGVEDDLTNSECIISVLFCLDGTHKAADVPYTRR